MTTAVLIVAAFMALLVGVSASITFGKEEVRNGRGTTSSAVMMMAFSLLALIVAFVAGAHAG